VQRDGALEAVTGTMGGSAQPQIVAMTLARAFAMGASPADAVAAPRWLVGGMAPERETPEVLAEADVPAPTVAALTASGYRVLTAPARSGAVGHAHMIRAVPGGFEAGSDPRADGGALAS